jgi:hypothetical protein
MAFSYNAFSMDGPGRIREIDKITVGKTMAIIMIKAKTCKFLQILI